MAIPLVLSTESEDISGDYSSLDKEDANIIVRELCNNSNRVMEYKSVSDNVRLICDRMIQIRNEMMISYNNLSSCIDMLKQCINDCQSLGIDEVEEEEEEDVGGDGNNKSISNDTILMSTTTTSTSSSSSSITTTNSSGNTNNINCGYIFPLASRVKCNCLLKIVVNHAVAGLYIGKNGSHLKRLQNQLQFRLTQSGRGAKGDFTGVGYPCHRTNTTLLFEGRLVDILYALRPLYRIIQDDILAFDEKSMEFLSGKSLRVKFELNLVVPTDRKRILLQDTGRRCMQLRNASGVDIIAGKQNFELGNIKESIVTLLGFEESVERACEWLGIFLQESNAISSGDYSFMDYPKYTLAIPEGTRR